MAIQAFRNSLVEDLEAAIRADTPLDHFVEAYSDQVQKELMKQAGRANRRAQAEVLRIDEQMPEGMTPMADHLRLDIEDVAGGWMVRYIATPWTRGAIKNCPR